MSSRIIYEKSGNLHVVIPAHDWEGTLDELASKDVPNGANYRIVETDSLPADRYFRNAWKDDGAKVDVDMPKARNIHMGKIRAMRNKRLGELDKRKYGAEFDTERDTLRDIPQSFDLGVASTASELKALWPEGVPID